MAGKNKPQKHSGNWLWLYALAVILLALAVNVAMCIPIPTLHSLTSGDWLNFWGGYLGGVLGCIPAFAALHESRRQARQQHDEVQAQLEESRRQTEQMLYDSQEVRRCSVMPLVDLTIFPLNHCPSTEELDEYWCLMTDTQGANYTYRPTILTSEKYRQAPGRYYVVYVRNIGLGPALNATVRDDKNCPFFDGDVSTTHDLKSILEITPIKHSEVSRPVNFVIQYTDVFSNLYQREYSVEWTYGGGFASKNFTPPRLIRKSDIPG